MEATLLVKVILPLALFIIMLGMGMSLKLADFKRVLVRPKAVALGLFAQMIILPALAYLIILALDMSGPIAVGLMILALCPGGSTSNLYTYLAKGDVALSVTLTSLVSLVAPFTVPLMIVLFMGLLMGEQEYIQLPVMATIIQLIVITVIPVAIGMFIHHKKPHLTKQLDQPVKLFSIIFLFLIVGLIIIKNRDNMFAYFAQAGLAAIILNFASFVVGYGLAKIAQLNTAQSKAISIEVGFQNGTLAIVIALTFLENPDMAVAATCYSISMFVLGAVFVGFFSDKSKDKKFAV